MLDQFIKSFTEPYFKQAADKAAQAGLSAKWGILLAGLAGMIACLFGGFENYVAGFVALVIFLVIIELTHKLPGESSFYLELRNLVYLLITNGFIFFLVISQSHQALAAAFIILTFSALVFSLRLLPAGKSHGEVNIIAGLVGKTETFIFLGLACLIPDAFAALGIIFAILCWITIAGRLWEGLRAS